MQIVFGEREIQVLPTLQDNDAIRASTSAQQDFQACGQQKMGRPCPDTNGAILCSPRECKLLTGGVDTSDLARDADTNALAWIRPTG